jgi:hypothetical protein
VAIFLSNRLSHTTRPAARPVQGGPARTPARRLRRRDLTSPIVLACCGCSPRKPPAQVASWLNAFNLGVSGVGL